MTVEGGAMRTRIILGWLAGGLAVGALLGGLGGLLGARYWFLPDLPEQRLARELVEAQAELEQCKRKATERVASTLEAEAEKAAHEAARKTGTLGPPTARSPQLASEMSEAPAEIRRLLRAGHSLSEILEEMQRRGWSVLTPSADPVFDLTSALREGGRQPKVVAVRLRGSDRPLFVANPREPNFIAAEQEEIRAACAAATRRAETAQRAYALGGKR